MTRKNKQLLLKDLSARLPYEVKVEWEGNTYFVDSINRYNELQVEGANFTVPIYESKPYLRPISSMTEEEQKEFEEFCIIDEDVWMNNGIMGYVNQSEIMSKGIDWLNAHHFDYRGLIEKGLALEATIETYNKE